jgi:broad-specificity NMP kinase
MSLVGAPKYHKYNAAVGVLECAKLELYRRLVSGYEDTKIIENGDVI